MNKYKYVAKDINNKIIRGSCYAESDSNLREILESKKLYLIKYVEYKKKIFQNYKFNYKDFLFFLNQIIVLLESNIEFEKALFIVKTSIRKKHFKSMIDKIYIDIENGISISESFGNFKFFPKMFIKMLKIGEKNNKLLEVFKQSKLYYYSVFENKNRIKSAMAYPVFLLVLGFCVLCILMYKIIPMFSNLFNSIDGEMPLITETILNISFTIKNNLILIISIIISIIAIISILIKTKKGIYIKDVLKVKLPFVHKLYMYYYSMLFTQGMHILISSGNSLEKASEEIGKIVGNNYLEKKFNFISKEIKSGKSIAKSIIGIGYFSIELTEMIEIGEMSNKLNDIMLSMYDYYKSIYNDVVERIIKKIEPLMILIIGGIIVIILLSLFMPILGIMDQIGSRV